MSARKTSSTGFSKMEKSFLASSTLKRNRRYLDIEKINIEEGQELMMRRRPRNSSKSVEAKINRSFSSSTAAFTDRLGRDISRFKERFSSQSQVQSQERPRTATSFYTARQTSPSPKSVRGVGIGQHLARQDYYKVREKPVLDERLFSNYKMEAADSAHMADLGRGPQRTFDNSLKHINDLEYNTQQLYQEHYYKRTTMDCRLHYRKQKEEERFFVLPRREQNKPATDLSPKAVKRAAETVEIKRPVDSFYMNSGRELPCQIEQRTATALTSHWRNRQNQIERAHPEYSVRVLKQKLCEERKQAIESSKHPVFSRGELCDRKFFIVQGQTG